MRRMNEFVTEEKVFVARDRFTTEKITCKSETEALGVALRQEIEDIRSRLNNVSRLIPVVADRHGIVNELDSIREDLLLLRDDYCLYKGVIDGDGIPRLWVRQKEDNYVSKE